MGVTITEKNGEFDEFKPRTLFSETNNETSCERRGVLGFYRHEFHRDLQ